MRTITIIGLLSVLAATLSAIAGYTARLLPLLALFCALLSLAMIVVILILARRGMGKAADHPAIVDSWPVVVADNNAASDVGLAKRLSEAEVSSAQAVDSAAQAKSQVLMVTKGIAMVLSRTPMMRALLRLVSDKSEAAVFDLIERFMAVSNQMGNVLSKADSVRSQVIGGSDGAVSAIVVDARTAAAAEGEMVKSLLSDSKATAKSTERMRELVEGSMDMLKDIEDVSERSRLIAFNLAVEAARIGRQGQGIKVIVNELSNINDKIIEFSKAVALRLKENRDLGVMIADRLNRETSLLAVKVKDGREASERALERLIATTNAVVGLLDTMTVSFDEARRTMDGMLTSMQFQDITRQQVETIDWVVADTSARLDELMQTLDIRLAAEQAIYSEMKDFRQRLLQQAKVQDEKALIAEVRI
jgi:methyl-accepting chemotaxis protein